MGIYRFRLTSGDRVLASKEEVEEALHNHHSIPLVLGPVNWLLEAEGDEPPLSAPVMQLGVELVHSWESRPTCKNSYDFASMELDNGSARHPRPRRT